MINEISDFISHVLLHLENFFEPYVPRFFGGGGYLEAREFLFSQKVLFLLVYTPCVVAWLNLDGSLI